MFPCPRHPGTLTEIDIYPHSLELHRPGVYNGFTSAFGLAPARGRKIEKPSKQVFDGFSYKREPFSIKKAYGCLSRDEKSMNGFETIKKPATKVLLGLLITLRTRAQGVYLIYNHGRDPCGARLHRGPFFFIPRSLNR